MFFLSVIFNPLTSDVDDITISIGGGVKLHLVFGDITNETTDAVVNSTNFKDFHYGKDVKNDCLRWPHKRSSAGQTVAE